MDSPNGDIQKTIMNNNHACICQFNADEMGACEGVGNWVSRLYGIDLDRSSCHLGEFLCFSSRMLLDK